MTFFCIIFMFPTDEFNNYFHAILGIFGHLAKRWGHLIVMNGYHMYILQAIASHIFIPLKTRWWHKNKRKHNLVI